VTHTGSTSSTDTQTPREPRGRWRRALRGRQQRCTEAQVYL